MPLALLLAADIARAPDPCAGKGTSIFVQAERRVLSLCEDGRRIESMRVALGTGGLDKRVEGDAKVPLGDYPLSSPIASKSYHLFIPVGYPTPAQKKAGYTGFAIGVHGPPRGFNHPTSTLVDWTLGCIAVGTDEEIDRVAAWVRSKRVRRVVIEAQ